MNILHLFPTAGFDRSTTTPVLLGVLISWLFTETLGWVFAGLVVPGYLAAVFVLDPRAGMIDVGEAVLTYAFARGIGEHLARTGVTSRVFGRERFLLVVISSILVRLLVEGAILPRVAPHAAGAFFSIGLVVVPLAANACWKTGLTRGVIQNGIPTLLVYVLLRWVLVPHTNLSLAGFELATEDIAASFLASPKAYILLITGAVLAAASNVLDGWDFNGILVPALLALVVIEPFKLVATFVEAILLVLIVALLLKTTRLGRANIEGPRRLVLYFGVDYALRFAFAAVAGRHIPGGDVVGLMGFGYLLPTLLAVKIAQRGSAMLVIMPTAQVSIAAFVLGTLIGFSAQMVDAETPAARAGVGRAMAKVPSDPAYAALFSAGLARRALHAPKNGSPIAPETIVSVVDDALQGVERAADHALGEHLAVQALDHDVVLVREAFEDVGDRYGDPTVLATVKGRSEKSRVIALVETPLSAPETAAIAGALLAEGKIDGVVVAGVEGTTVDTSSSFHDVARQTALALAKNGDDAGTVVALVRGDAMLFSGPSSSRLDALVGSLGEVARGETTGDLAKLAIPMRALERFFPEATKDDDASIASPAAIATLLESAEASSAPDEEHLLATRDLLIEPLLMRGAKPESLPLLRLSARALGYRLVGPSRGLGSDAMVALVPRDHDRPIALLVRDTGAQGTIVEVPHATHTGLRDLALRFAAALGPDAVLLGLEPGRSARGGAAMRIAHAIAAASYGDRSPAVVLLREAGADAGDGVAMISTWGGDEKASLAVSAKGALDSIGVANALGPIDDGARELSGRAIVGEVPLVSVVVDASAIRAAGLDEARNATKGLVSAGFVAYDGALGDVADRLAGSLAATTDAPTDLALLARETAIESSIVARRALQAAIDASSARAAIVRAKEGDFLVVVGKTGGKLLAAATPTDPRIVIAHPDTFDHPTHQPTLHACASTLFGGGACVAEAP